ncbi:tail fiber repeat 2 protein [Rahnella aceris]|uniref:Tail fiber repeat 2 protein n=1 Tax=Rahnella sp. (strain Y9602) TaxID=2703885 RepID=A0A0H3F5Q0_RAHSY|nr:phage tail protein [Rahnella aceris]ADW72223.1 tail fiber repeat 2 protein [Rahnella aceris]
MSTFKSVVTTLGQSRIAAAIAAGIDINITQLAVGDGNGKATTPVATQTKLVKEVYRTPLNSLKLDPSHGNWVIAEAVISASVGGFWMREMGLFADDGTLIAVCNMADTYKPTLAEGSGRTQTLRMVIAVSNTEAISLLIDDSVIMATEQYVNDLLAAHEKSRNHPDGTLTAKGFVQLSSAVTSTSEVLAATPKAVKAANDNANSRVPSTRKVNNKALSADITLEASDVGAMSNLMLATDTTKVKRLDDPSIIDVTNPISISATFEDHPLGATYVVAGQLHNWRRYWVAGAAAYQRLINNDGQIFERIGSYTAAGGWKWFLSDSGYPFGWRKILDSGSMTLTDLTRLGVAQSGENADITGLSKLTSIASSVKMAANLEVASSIQANYRMAVFRANDYEAYMSFTSRLGSVSANNLPSALTSMGNVYFRLPNTLTDTDPHAGRALGGLSAAVYPTGEGVMRMDARDEAGTIKARIVCDGQTDSVQIANGVLRPESGITLSSTNANSVIRGRNDAVILRDHNNGNITLSASLKDAGTQIGGTLYIGYNRPEANIFTSAVSIDSPVTVNEIMKVVKDATFAGAMTVTGEVNFSGMVKFNRHEATCQFSSSDAAYPLINVSYSNAGNFGFWDATNGKWVLRKRASNLKDGTADNWVMDGGLEVTGAYGLTLSTALPVSSGGTGAKTATEALKNLGGLPSNGTAVAAAKLATARKIAGVAFDGTQDIGLNADNVGAFPRAGGDVNGRVTANYLRAITIPHPGDGQGTYLGWNESGGQGESDFVNNRGGGVGGFLFRTVNQANSVQTGFVRFTGTGDLATQGSISAEGGGIYEMGQRVFSPNNRQPVNSNTANLGGGWWRCGDTGMIKQWGVVNKGSRGWSTVNFPIPFPSACVNVQVTAINGGGGTFNDNFGTAQIINNIGFTCGQDSGGSYWEATGW